MKGHLKHMLVGAVALLAVFLALGVPAANAVRYALLLACPLMMITMMAMMGHGDGQGHDRRSDDQRTDPERAQSSDRSRPE